MTALLVLLLACAPAWAATPLPLPKPIEPEAQVWRNMAAVHNAFAEESARRAYDPGNPVASYQSPRLAPRASLAKGAKECPSMDVQAALGDVRNQDGVGWCFAYVVADLLSFRTGQRLAPFDLSLQYYQNFAGQKDGPSLATRWMGGSPAEAFDLAAKVGICTEEDMPSTDLLLSRFSVDRLTVGQGAPASILDITDVSFRVLREGLTTLLAQKGRTVDEIAADPSYCATIASAELLFPRLEKWEVLAGLSSNRTDEAVLNWLTTRSCPKGPVKPERPVRFTWYQNQKRERDLLGELDRGLSENQPVAIAFDPRAFLHVHPDSKLLHHGALVVKREFRDGQCRYLVRNSMGPSCLQNKPPYDAPEVCSRGHFWVSEQAMSKALSGVGVME